MPNEGQSKERDTGDPFALVGTILERKYRMDRPVAEGGFGVVYAAHHLALDVPIAIKVLKPLVHLDPDAWADALDRFLLEARTIAKLRHPSVVQVLDAGVTHIDGWSGGVPWMVLEWLDGETLKDDLVARRGAGGRSPSDCLTLMRPILDALVHAHAAGVAHRDLKPSNIMLVPVKDTVIARVVDFGVAKLMQHESGEASGHTTTEATVKAFSAAYASPEQVSGTRTGPWTDVHALGLVLTELLTGDAVYPSDPTARFAAVFDAHRPTPALRGVDVGAWEPVIAKALAVRPADRYPDAAALLAALDEGQGDAQRAWTSRPSANVGAPNATPSAARVPIITLTEKSVAIDAPHDSEAARDARTGPATRRRAVRRSVIALLASAIVVGGIAVVRLRGRAVATPLPPASASALPAGACTSNAACVDANGGRPFVCRPERGCVALESEDCSVLGDRRDLVAADTVWVGTMFPEKGEDGAEFGMQNHNAVELARRDFAEAMAGLTSGGGARRIGVVACDDTVDPGRAARHLVDDVGVPAVIGFRSSTGAIELSNSLFVPRGVLAVAALNSNPLVTAVPQPETGPRLVFRTTYSNDDAAHVLSALVDSTFEPQVRAANEGVGPTHTMKVALLRPKNAAGSAFSDAVFRSLRFNGKSALENGYDFHESTYDPADEGAYGSLAPELAAFAPHVILFAGASSIVRTVFTPLEQKWRPRYRPRYASVSLLSGEILKFIGTSADRRKRFFGVTPVSTTPANARFVMHYNETFADKITRTIAPNSSYDAFYLVGLGTVALGKEPVSGAALARALERLGPPGRPVEVGLSGILGAITTLRSGQSIDIRGATGRLDFDFKTGESAFDYTVLCAGVDGDGRAFDGVESGLVYVADSKRLEGTMHCP